MWVKLEHTVCSLSAHHSSIHRMHPLTTIMHHHPALSEPIHHTRLPTLLTLTYSWRLTTPWLSNYCMPTCIIMALIHSCNLNMYIVSLATNG